MVKVKLHLTQHLPSIYGTLAMEGKHQKETQMTETRASDSDCVLSRNSDVACTLEQVCDYEDSYPRYQKGNPQLRVFLPNFWMKLKKPWKQLPPNVVHFACSMEMTDYDVRNYLQKIYNIPVVNVHTYIKMGRFRKALGANYIVKDDDTRIAVIILPVDEKFVFPNLFPEEMEEESKKSMEEVKSMKKDWEKGLDKIKNRPGVPTWFGL